MRILLVLVAALIAGPALAQANLAQVWSHYGNARFGYELDIPPGFEGHGESGNGDGQGFYRIEAEQGLVVWGGNLLASFSAEAEDALARASAENWAVTEQAVTPQWAGFSGQRDHRVFHQRMILLCDGNSYAAFRAEYNLRDLPAMTNVIAGLVRSFVPMGC
ncbi:MAG: hypothetical protein ABS75_18295 [Pelagibacterium sp. SCN 63-23]|nr:MAG: hypothetical protein ABS75_18295 [Pelagibacterium sp. SCN 63-23]